MTIVLQDSFQRANVASNSWGTATDGNAWTLQENTGGTVDVTSNEGRIGNSNTGAVDLTLGTTSLADGEVLFRWQPSNAGDDCFAILRFQSVGNFYYLGQDLSGSFALKKRVADAGTTLTSTANTLTAGTWYWVKARAVGTTLSAKIWADGSAEPGSWTLTITDSTYTTAGKFGIHAADATASNTLLVDNFSVSDLISITVVGSATGNTTGAGSSVTVTKPTGVATGDLLLLFVDSESASGAATSTGFSLVGDKAAAAQSMRTTLLSKIATGSEPTSYTVATATGNFISATCIALRGADPVNPVDFSSNNTTTGSTTVSSGSITITDQDLLLFHLSLWTGNLTVTTPPSGFTSRFSDVVADQFLYSKSVLATGTSGTVSATISAADTAVEWLIAVKANTGPSTIAETGVGKEKLQIDKPFAQWPAAPSHFTTRVSLTQKPPPAAGGPLNIDDLVPGLNTFFFGPQPPAVTTTDITVTETGTGADAVGVDVAGTVADAGAGTDALAIAAGLTIADAGVGADTTAITQPTSVSDAGTGADALSIAASTPVSDAGVGTDSASVAASLAIAQTGAGVDVPAVVAAVPVADAGTGVDAVSVGVPINISDAGTGTDAIASIATTLSVADVGAGTDAPSVAASLAINQSGAGTDTVSTVAAVPVADAGVGTDALAIGFAALVAETGQGTDSISVAVVASVGDAGTATDGVGVGVAVGVAETGAGADVVNVGQPTNVSDAGAGTDAVAVAAAVPVSQVGVGADALSVAASTPVADAGVGTDSISVTVLATVTDTGHGLDVVTSVYAVLIAETGVGIDAIAILVPLQHIIIKPTGAGALTSVVGASALPVGPAGASGITSIVGTSGLSGGMSGTGALTHTEGTGKLP